MTALLMLVSKIISVIIVYSTVLSFREEKDSRSLLTPEPRSDLLLCIKIMTFYKVTYCLMLTTNYYIDRSMVLNKSSLLYGLFIKAVILSSISVKTAC